MPDVTMSVPHPRPVGAFMSALTRVPETQRPDKVEGLVKLLASYMNDHFLDAENPVDGRRPAPALNLQAPEGGVVVARFVPDVDGDTDANAMGRWIVSPYFEIANVRRNADLELRHHSAEQVVFRLPQPAILAQAEEDAKVLSGAGDADKFTGPGYYYDYFGAQSKLSTMEYLWSRIADYTTAHCR